MISNFYDIGDRVTAFVTFRDQDGDVGDPGEVFLLVGKPDGTTTIVDTFATHVTDSGYYEVGIEIDQSGRWELRWEGLGAITAAEADRFFVRQQNVIVESS